MTRRRDALLLASAAILSASSGLIGCSGQAKSPLIPLKDRVAFPLGGIAKTSLIQDAQWRDLISRHCDRFTPEWEMKMEYILKDDGSLRFDAPDALVGFARDHGLEVFGHVLIWYAQGNSPYFQYLSSDKRQFSRAYHGYITNVVSHFKDKLCGWDVINEPVDDQGMVRDCLWRQNLGDDYMNRAFDVAHEADPTLPLFINDYNLEVYPQKRLGFMRLIESLLKAGAPISGIGTQTHIDANLTPGAIKQCLADLEGFGLKLHVSEVDISLREANKNPIYDKQLRLNQARLLEELGRAVRDISVEQNFGVTFWGLRDKDSWYNDKAGTVWPDEPNLFDNYGRLKTSSEAFFQ
jgi:endo-1,4-beta-xylanase